MASSGGRIAPPEPAAARAQLSGRVIGSCRDAGDAAGPDAPKQPSILDIADSHQSPKTSS